MTTHAPTGREADKVILANTIHNENTIISQRMGWGLQLQGFLFAAFFLADPNQAEAGRVALAITGLLAAVSSFTGSFFGNRALIDAIRAFDALQAEDGDARVQAGRRFRFAPVFLMPHLFIPAAIAAVWGYLAWELIAAGA